MKYFLIFLLVFPFCLSAQQPVNWTIDIEHIEGDRYNIIYRADIEDGWNVYSQFIDEGGPVPTSITYESLEGVTLIGDAKETGARKEGMDPLFEMRVIKYLSEEVFTITQEITTDHNTDEITGYLTYMCCNDEKCLPPTDVEFTLRPKDIKKKPTNKKLNAGSSGAQQSSSTSDPSDSGTFSTAAAIPLGLNEEVNHSENSPPVKWSFEIRHVDTDIYDLVYTATIDQGWTVYSQYIDDGGPFPTTITYEQPSLIELLGTAQESGHKKEGLDPLFEMNVIKFYAPEPYVITQRVRLKNPTQAIAGYITSMSCDDEKCLPPSDTDFLFYAGDQLVSTITTGDNGMAAGLSSDPISSTIGVNAKGLKVIDQVRPRLRETHAAPAGDCGETDTKNSSLWLMFGFGFLGGLLALLTPCVFPMIPLTVSFFTKDTKRKGWVSALIYAFSIMFIYVSIGLLITGIFGASALNALSTNWIANTLFFIIFMFFAFSFFGFYELTLPSSWTTKTDSMADRGGLVGIFFMAFTLALVSFSCTGPIIGTALVQSATSQLGPFIVMLGFSMALALPFGLFAAFPAFLNSLPQSGGWMNSVKVVLGFLEVALAFKFLSVADLTSHWGFLRYELFLAIWIAVALAMALYGFGWLRFPHDSAVHKLSPRRWVFSLGSIALAIYLASGFVYNDKIASYDAPGLLSGIAPPSTYNFFLKEPAIEPAMKAKYPSFSKCANNINCFKDYYEGMAYAKENGKPVLLDHTGYGCVNCRKTEEFIWIDDRVRKMLNEDYVLISLYVDDREVLDEVLISKTSKKKIRNVGNKWTDFQIVNFDQISQPLYVMVSPDEEVLALPRGYKEGISDYLSFLECGLETFKAVSMQ